MKQVQAAVGVLAALKAGAKGDESEDKALADGSASGKEIASDDSEHEHSGDEEPVDEGEDSHSGDGYHLTTGVATAAAAAVAGSSDADGASSGDEGHAYPTD